MNRRLKIALALPDFEPWGLASFLNGVTDYARVREWVLTHCPADPESSRDCPLRWSNMKSWPVDGLIIGITEPAHLKQLKKLNIPTVNIAGDAFADSGMAAVAPNSRMIGKLAAQHLLSLGLRNFAYHGVEGRFYSELRWQGFRDAVREAGQKAVKFCVAHTVRDGLWNERHDKLRKWLSALPKPVGLFAVHDYRALIAMSACRDIGLRIPDDVAVIGADNNLMVCNFSSPTLTSISIDAYRMGQTAASLLDNLLQGKPSPSQSVLIDPTGVVSRDSTDVLHLNDEVAEKAVRLMRSSYSKQFKITTIADAVGVSRRSLEMRFRKTLQTSPAEYLAKLRVQKAVHFLRGEPTWTHGKIAKECGFMNTTNLRAAFRRVLQAAPQDFRTPES